MHIPIKKITLLFSFLLSLSYHANCQKSSSAKTDTIVFKDGTFILLVDHTIVMNDAAKKISTMWKTDPSRRQDLSRMLLHNWTKLIGIKAASLLDFLGPPDFYPLNEYKYENENPTDSTFTGCRLTIIFTNKAVSYFWISCPS